MQGIAFDAFLEKLTAYRKKFTFAVLLREEPELSDRPLDAVPTSDLSELIKRFKVRKRRGSTINRYLALISITPSPVPGRAL